jgi:hypothetical protein
LDFNVQKQTKNFQGTGMKAPPRNWPQSGEFTGNTPVFLGISRNSLDSITASIEGQFARS